jgi:hypothetical protein
VAGGVRVTAPMGKDEPVAWIVPAWDASRTIGRLKSYTKYDILCPMPRARLLLHRKRHYDDGAISEVKLWLLSQPVPGSMHPFKYSLFYGHPGRRAVAYDNERGKGDHRHKDEVETQYAFESLDKLLEDFEADVEALRREEGEDG